MNFEKGLTADKAYHEIDAQLQEFIECENNLLDAEAKVDGSGVVLPLLRRRGHRARTAP
jgi:hypothetical protein